MQYVSDNWNQECNSSDLMSVDSKKEPRVDKAGLQNVTIWAMDRKKT